MKNILFFLLPVVTLFSCDKQPEEQKSFLDKNGIPIPTHSYVNDFSGKMLDTLQVAELNFRLKAYEDSTTTQIVVICLPELPKNSNGSTWEIADLAVETGRVWGIGQKDKNNGVLFLVAFKDHKDHIATGYGTEGALPDIICKQILDDDVEPWFKDEKYYDGIEKCITRIQRALAGEYLNDKKQEKEETMFWIWLAVGLGICAIVGAIFHLGIAAGLGGVYGFIYWFVLKDIFLISLFAALIAGAVAFIAAFILRIGVGGGVGEDGGWSSSGGGWSSGGSSGFSGGGGSFGGGGASGSW